MSSNDETHESDEHEEEEVEEDNEVGSAVEHEGSDQEGSNQQQVEDDDEHENNTPLHHDDEEEEEEEDHETREDVDRTNPLDEDSVEAAQNLTQEDVFGEDLSDSSDDEEGRHRQRYEGQNEGPIDDEDLVDVQEEEQIVVDTPHVKADLGRDIHLVKLPSFMKVEPKPFDSQYFHDEVRDDDDEESKARLKLQIENTIRWRYNTNEAGEFVRESNTRLVRWSDGSLSLHVGKEIFDVSKANIQSDHNHLFVRHQKSMQAQAVFRTKLAFRQHAHDSLAHLKLKFASKANPAPKVRVLSNIKAASVNVLDMKKRDEQRIKAEERRRNQQLRQRERAAHRDRNISTGYFEDDEDNEQVSLSAIKKNVKMKKLQGDYRTEVSDDDEDEDEEDNDNPREKFIGQRSTTSTKHRKLTASDEEKSDDEEKESKRKRFSSIKTDEEQQSD